jgi:hypothetical protein
VPEEKVVAAPSPPPAPPPARPEEKIAAATPQPPAPPTPTAPPPDQQVAAVPPVPPNARDVLEEALKGMNCAAIHVRPSADGTMAVFGSVADEESRAKLRTIAATLPAAQRPALSVDIIPAPLCHSVVQIDNLPRDGVAAAGVIEAKLLGDPVLHENQPIQVEVDSQASYPIVVRIDYFTLDDQVLHMWPNEFISATQVAPGEKKKFLHRRPDGPDPDWLVGGAPFGTELISVIATPRPLNLGAKRPMIESATTYLKDLTNALRLMRATGAQPALVATTFIHTAGQ